MSGIEKHNKDDIYMSEFSAISAGAELSSIAPDKQVKGLLPRKILLQNLSRRCCWLWVEKIQFIIEMYFLFGHQRLLAQKVYCAQYEVFVHPSDKDNFIVPNLDQTSQNFNERVDHI